MNFAWQEAGTALVMLIATGLMVAAYLRYKAARSESRMTGMLQRVGLDPEVFDKENAEAAIGDIRRRCRNCQAEDVCERWLAGKFEGTNSFCPNRRIFERLAGRAQAA